MMERRLMVRAILNPLKRFSVKEPELLASLIADSIMDAADIVGLVSPVQAPPSPEDLGQEDFSSPAPNRVVNIPQPPLQTREPAKLILVDTESVPQSSAIRPNRSGRSHVSANIWEFKELLESVKSISPVRIEIDSPSGSLAMMRSIDQSEGAHGSGGFVKLSYSAGSSNSPDNVEAVSLGPISVSRTFTEMDEKPLDFKSVMLDLHNKAAAIVRTRRGVPVVSKNPLTTTSQGEAFSGVMRDAQKPAGSRQFVGNSEDV